MLISNNPNLNNSNFLGLSNKVYNIIPYLFSIILLIYVTKPNIAFKPNGQLRNFGFGFDEDSYKKTLYTMQNIIIFLTVILYVYL